MDDGIPTGAIVVISIGCFFMSCCCCLFVISCIKRKNVYDQTTVGQQTPVIVTSATHTAPNGYTVPQMPVGGAYQTQIFLTPYVAQGASVHKPADHILTSTAGIHHNVVTSYPTMIAENMNPPSYDLAVSGGVANRNQ